MENLKQIKRELSGETLRTAKKAAKKENVCVDTLLWLLLDNKSRAFCDAPECAKLDGVINVKIQDFFHYAPWELTEKGKDILAKTK